MDAFWMVLCVIGVLWAYGFIFAYVFSKWYYRKQEWFMRHGPDDYFFGWSQYRYVLARALMSWWQVIRLAWWKYLDWQKGR